MSKLKIDDLAFEFPDSNKSVSEIQDKIATRYEFRKESAYFKEIGQTVVLKSGEKLYHQITTNRYLLYQDKLFAYHETGTGKTCVAVNLAESCRIGYENAQSGNDFVDSYLSPNPSHIKQCIVLVQNTSLINEFCRQMIDKCTDPSVYSELHSNIASSRNRFSAIRKFFVAQRFYKFYTYRIFFNKFNKDTPEALKKEFSNTLFILDEVHNLFHTSDTTKRKTSLETEDVDFVPDVPDEIEIEIAKENNTTKGAGVKISQVYAFIRSIFSSAEDYKSLFLSATPMTSNDYDILYLLGLMYPKKVEYPSAGEEVTSEDVERNLQEIIKDLAGKVSYFKAPDDMEVKAITNKRLSVELPLENIPEKYKDEFRKYSNLYATFMGDEQKNRYLEIKEKEEKGKLKQFYLEGLKASVAVYPIIDGVETNNDFFFEKNRDPKTDLSLFIDEDKERLFDEHVMKNVDTLSSKFPVLYDICRGLLTSGEKDDKDSIEYIADPRGVGKTFIFFLYITTVGLDYFVHTLLKTVVNPWVNIYEQKNFVLYRPGENVSIYEVSGVVSLKSDWETDYRRVAILTGESAKRPNIFSDILRIYNHPDNWDGKYIRVLIATPVAKEGLNILDGMNVVVVTPNWLETTTYQIKTRNFRVGGHSNFMMKRGQVDHGYTKSLSDIRIRRPGKLSDDFYVKTYDLVSVPQPRTAGLSDDILVYNTAVERGYKIKLMEKRLKEIAFDYPLHYEHNKKLDTRNIIMGYNFPLKEPNKYPSIETITDRGVYLNMYTGQNVPSMINLLGETSKKVDKIKMSKLTVDISPQDVIPSLVKLFKGKKQIVITINGYNFTVSRDENYIVFAGGSVRERLTISSNKYNQHKVPSMTKFLNDLYIDKLAETFKGDLANYIRKRPDKIVEELRKLRSENLMLYFIYIETIIFGYAMKYILKKNELIDLFYPMGNPDLSGPREYLIKVIDDVYNYLLLDKESRNNIFNVIYENFMTDIQILDDGIEHYIYHTRSSGAGQSAYILSHNINFPFRKLKDGKWESIKDKDKDHRIRGYKVRIIYDKTIKKTGLEIILVKDRDGKYKKLDFRIYRENPLEDYTEEEYIKFIIERKGAGSKGTGPGTGNDSGIVLESQSYELYQNNNVGKSVNIDVRILKDIENKLREKVYKYDGFDFKEYVRKYENGIKYFKENIYSRAYIRDYINMRLIALKSYVEL